MNAERSIVTKLTDDLTLTGSAVASTVHYCAGYGQHTLYVQYNPDTDSTNALSVTIELSPDYDLSSSVGNWYPYTGEYSAATGTLTEGAQVTLSFPSDGTAVQNEPPYFFVGAAMAIRIKVSETNSPGDFGAVSAHIISTHP